MGFSLTVEYCGIWSAPKQQSNTALGDKRRVTPVLFPNEDQEKRQQKEPYSNKWELVRGLKNRCMTLHNNKKITSTLYEYRHNLTLKL